MSSDLVDDASQYIVDDDYRPPDEDGATGSSLPAMGALPAMGEGDGGISLRADTTTTTTTAAEGNSNRSVVSRSKRLSTLFLTNGQKLEEVADEAYGSANYSKLPKHFGCDNDVTPRWVMSVWLANNAMTSPQRPLLDLVMAPDLVAVLGLFTQVPITESDDLARSVVRLFERYNDTLRLIKGAIRAEVASNLDANTLFRANSMATKIMSVYSRMVGGNLLTHTLKKCIDKVVSKNNPMEVDPHKEPDANKIKENMQLLRDTAQMFLDAILSSIEKTPHQFRVICNSLEEEVTKKFGVLKMSPVNGFIFLRFFCPVITLPQTYELMKKAPTPEVQRALILVSKVLQNLANGQAFGGKEIWMVDLNTFIMDNLENVKQFAKHLSIVPNIKEPPPPSKISNEMASESLYKIAKHFEQAMPKLKQKLSSHVITATVSYKIDYRMDAVLNPDKMNKSMTTSKTSEKNKAAEIKTEYKAPIAFTVDPLPNLVDMLFATDLCLATCLIELFFTKNTEKRSAALSGSSNSTNQTAHVASCTIQLFDLNNKGALFAEPFMRKACKHFVTFEDFQQNDIVQQFFRGAIISSAKKYWDAVFADVTSSFLSSNGHIDLATVLDICHRRISLVKETSAPPIFHHVCNEVDKKWMDKGAVLFQTLFFVQGLKPLMDNIVYYKNVIPAAAAGVAKDSRLQVSLSNLAKEISVASSQSLDGNSSSKMKEIRAAFFKQNPVGEGHPTNSVEDSNALVLLVEELFAYVRSHSSALFKLFQDHRSQESVTYKILEILEAVVFLFLTHTAPPKAKGKEKEEAKGGGSKK